MLLNGLGQAPGASAGDWTWVGPLRVGGRYFCGYWQDSYRVIDFRGGDDGSMTRVRVQWSDGHKTVHCTAWDYRRDSVIEQAEPAGPIELT